MENCLNTTQTGYKQVEDYKKDIENTIKYIAFEKECLVFAVVAERTGITQLIIMKYPELRSYILQKIAYYENVLDIDMKINKAVLSLIKRNKSITLISIMDKCKISSDTIYHNQYLKGKVFGILAQYNKPKCRNK